MPGMLKSKWAGPYVIIALHSNGAVEISESTPNSESFVVNGHRLKVFGDNNVICVLDEIPLQPHPDVA